MSELQTLCETTGLDEQTAIKFVHQHYGVDATEFDYKVVGAAFSLRSLPPSYAMTAMVKTMRGTAKGKVAQNRPEFGLVRGMKKYKVLTLSQLVTRAMRLLEQADAMETEDLVVDDDDISSDNYAPEFLTYGDSQHIVNKEVCENVGKLFVECGKKYGKAAPEPERKVTSNVKPQDLLNKLKKDGIWNEAMDKAEALIDDLDISDVQPSMPVRNDFYWFKTSYGSSYKEFRSKSVKNGVLTVTFYVSNDNHWSTQARKLGAKRYMPPKEEGSRYCSGQEYKDSILTTKWSLDGSKLIEWNVELKHVKNKW